MSHVQDLKQETERDIQRLKFILKFVSDINKY